MNKGKPFSFKKLYKKYTLIENLGFDCHFDTYCVTLETKFGYKLYNSSGYYSGGYQAVDFVANNSLIRIPVFTNLVSKNDSDNSIYFYDYEYIKDNFIGNKNKKLLLRK